MSLTISSKILSLGIDLQSVKYNHQSRFYLSKAKLHIHNRNHLAVSKSFAINYKIKKISLGGNSLFFVILSMIFDMGIFFLSSALFFLKRIQSPHSLTEHPDDLQIVLRRNTNYANTL
uniref:Uncharacterized protein n=1 Tax=Chaetoceros debilis TaxID=122233 RepID=A0A7S3VET3_9STRA